MPETWSWIPPMMGPPNRGRDVLLDGEEDLGLGPGLLGLGYVQVHLVAVKIGVVGGQTAGFSRKVFPSITRIRWAMMDIRCSDGCRLKSTMSPFRSCRSTSSRVRPDPLWPARFRSESRSGGCRPDHVVGATG